MSLQASSASLAEASSLKPRMISPSCMMLLLLHQRRCRRRHRNAGDFSTAGQYRNVLGQRPMLDAGREIVGDTVAREFVRQNLSGRVLVEPDHMKAVAGFGDGELSRLHALQSGLELGCGLAARQLTEPAPVFG